MTKRTGQRYYMRALMLALGFFLLLPLATTTNAQNRRERREDRRERREDRREDRRERREERRDVDGDGDFDQRDRIIRQQQRSNGAAYGRYRDPRDRDGDGDYDQRDAYIIQQQQRNSGYGIYGNNGGYRNTRGYGNYGYGNYNQSQQTALNAGYNEGIKEGRKDRGRGGYRNVNDFSAYRNADKDYNSRYGDRYQYQQYFRRGFQNGYNDGVQGY